MRDRKLDDLITMLERAKDTRRDQIARRSSAARLHDPILTALGCASDFLCELRKQHTEVAS
jgi:hypothetical protein